MTILVTQFIEDFEYLFQFKEIVLVIQINWSCLDVMIDWMYLIFGHELHPNVMGLNICYVSYGNGNWTLHVIISKSSFNKCLYFFLTEIYIIHIQN